MKEQAATDIEAAKAQVLADLRSEVATLAIGAAEKVVRRSLDRDTNVALIEQFINEVADPEQLMAEGNRNRAYAAALFAVAQAEGQLAEVEDELFPSPGPSRATTSCATRSPTPHLPADRRQQIVEDLSAPGPPTSPSASSRWSWAPVAGGSCRRSSTSSWTLTAPQEGRQVAEVRSAVELTEDQRTRLAEALKTGHRHRTSRSR